MKDGEKGKPSQEGVKRAPETLDAALGSDESGVKDVVLKGFNQFAHVRGPDGRLVQVYDEGYAIRAEAGVLPEVAVMKAGRDDAPAVVSVQVANGKWYYFNARGDVVKVGEE